MSSYRGPTASWTDTAWPQARRPPPPPRAVNFGGDDVICLPLADVRAMCPALAPKPRPRPQPGCVPNFGPIR